ncbi:hypothetical protein [Paraburkholderia sp. 40]|uniref:hypothetical protein n=1 Tax=Paraburkholderia sp. 40 TaxID=2991059 RepID=UPI003D19FBAC
MNAVESERQPAPPESRCNCCVWLFDVLTNLGPPFIALCLIASIYNRLGTVGTAVVIGLMAVAVAAGVAYGKEKFQKKREKQTVDERDIQPTLDKMSWGLMAAVLLPSAVDEITQAFYYRGHIHWLTDKGFSFVSGSIFNGLDVFSLAFGIVMIFAPLFALPIGAAFEKLQKKFGKLNQTKDENTFDKGHSNSIAVTLVLLAVMVVGTIVYFAPVANHNEPNFNPPGPPPLYTWQLVMGSLGIGLFLAGYLGNRKTIFELSCQSDRAEDDDKLLWLRTLKALTFESVVIPPLIGSAALVSNTLDSASTVVYGLFIYSGFSVWNLSVKVIGGASNPLLGVSAVVLQFFYSFLMTVLWVVVFWKLEEFVNDGRIFDAVLRVSLAAIFVQLVFGPVYRNAWGNHLSDRWFLEGPEYSIVATIICLGLGAIPERVDYKLCVTGAAIFLLVFVPAFLLRRSMTAYVLIRVRPGRTGEVRKALLAEDVASAVLYGDYDLLAKVELPGSLSIFGSKAMADSMNLGLLAALVKRAVRRTDVGVTETQTLLDFSHAVHLPTNGRASQRGAGEKR